MTSDKYEQLHLDLGVELPETEQQTTTDSTDMIETQEQLTTPLAKLKDADALPATLRASAASAIDLRAIQKDVASIIANPEYLSLLASTNPETVPEIMNAITNAVSVSDNLMIQLAKVSEKSASMQKLFELMIAKQQTKEEAIKTTDEYYDESIEKIKRSIYRKLSNGTTRKTSADFINPEIDDVIDAEYTDTTDTKEP